MSKLVVTSDKQRRHCKSISSSCYYPSVSSHIPDQIGNLAGKFLQLVAGHVQLHQGADFAHGQGEVAQFIVGQIERPNGVVWKSGAKNTAGGGGGVNND